MPLETISPQRLAEICQQGSATVIDVRTPREFQEVHAIYAQNMPLDQLKPEALQELGDCTIYLICRSGGRGQKACEKLLAAGFSNVVNVEGGTLAWDRCGLPVKRGAKMMPIEQQVRITAGVLVAIGVVLALLVNPWFVLLSVGVGAGLVFAGITNACLMGLVMAKMPWNQVNPQPSTCARPEGQS